MAGAIFRSLGRREFSGLALGLIAPSLTLGHWVLAAQGFGVELWQIALIFSGVAYAAALTLGVIPLILLHDLLNWMKAGRPAYMISWAILGLAVAAYFSGFSLDHMPPYVPQALLVGSFAGGGWVFWRMAVRVLPRNERPSDAA